MLIVIITTHLPDFDHARVSRHLRRYSMINTIWSTSGYAKYTFYSIWSDFPCSSA